MVTEPPHSKRPRTEEHAEGSNLTRSTLEQDTEVWLADGNIVIIAQTGTAFRVHKSTLAQRSEVFRDLFTVPAPETVASFDGCPLVYVSDSPDDLRRLLLVLCCGKKWVLPCINETYTH